MVTWATHPCLGIVVRPNPVNHPSVNTLAGIAYVVLSVACFAVLDCFLFAQTWHGII